MDTTQIVLILMPLAIGLQTFWIACAIDGLRGDINIMRGDINNLRGELHAHELGCQKRSQKSEVRLDRLERVPTEIPHP